MSIASKRGNEDVLMESNASKQSENWADMDNEGIYLMLISK